MSPDRSTGLLHAMPFVGVPLFHLPGSCSVARSGARGVRCLEERLRNSLILSTTSAVGGRMIAVIGGNSGQS